GPVVALRRDGASITLEPAAQLELSGAPLSTIHETAAEFEGHMEELAPVSERLGIAWLGLGLNPLHRRDQLPWVPKLRYGVMREYLPTRGPLALDMMQRTCTVQANLDYASEADAMRKLRVGLRASPIVTAMFANSPLVEGARSGEASHRALVWLHMDPDRSGMLPFAWSEKSGYRDYVEWALDVPMFLVKRGPKVLKNTGQTFRAFWKDGFEGERATFGDWESHLATLFPEVRLKRTLEVRGADGQSTALTCALPALWKGLLYDDRALDALEHTTRALTFESAEAVRPAIADRGLRAEYGGRPLTEWAAEILEIAEGGLERIGDLNSHGQDERIHLAKLKELIERGQSPSDALLEKLSGGGDLREGVLLHAHV
ncbi:MAG: glutamate--cysteine ligase, partial [Myxococcales bacterium]|nr:glutamate--cysteine ligase [Myxococcales bacterium]